MPARARKSGGVNVTSAPANEIVPVVGMVSPARQLKNVDLPAPFGPISPMISPSSTDKSAPATARKSPNAFETFLASSSMGALSQERRQPVPQIEQAARLEAGDQHDDAAVENIGQSRTAAAEPGIGRGLQRDQDQRAEQRAEQRAGAAERSDDHHLHGDQNAETGIRIDETGLDHIQRTGDRREGGRQRQR